MCMVCMCVSPRHTEPYRTHSVLLRCVCVCVAHIRVWVDFARMLIDYLRIVLNVHTPVHHTHRHTEYTERAIIRVFGVCMREWISALLLLHFRFIVHFSLTVENHHSSSSSSSNSIRLRQIRFVLLNADKCHGFVWVSVCVLHSLNGISSVVWCAMLYFMCVCLSVCVRVFGSWECFGGCPSSRPDAISQSGYKSGNLSYKMCEHTKSKASNRTHTHTQLAHNAQKPSTKQCSNRFIA